MLTAVAALILMAMPQEQQANPAGQLVSKMLQHYSDAKSLTGTITYTATDGTGQAQLVTTLAYDKPSRLYVLQKKGGKEPKQWLIVSDGKKFSYDVPDDLVGSQSRHVTEPVRQTVIDDATSKPVLVNYDIGRIYTVGAPGLGDRSVPLDIAIGRREDLQHDVLMWMTVEANGKTKVNGLEVNSIVGKWRPYGDYFVRDPNFPPGRYEMLIADDGRLMRYSVFRYIGTSGNQAVALKETWDVDLDLNGKPSDSVFRVP